MNYHHQLPLSAAWGDGTFSSSDAQRVTIGRGSILASFYPRYFGYYERAVGVYTHVSDQHSVFASRVISCAPREALYVLDGLLENDTILAPRSHTTDTHGATEQVFALCYLLGIAFMPRLADVADVQLYRLDRSRAYGALEPLLRTVDTTVILEQWDHIVRIAASIRDRSSPAHVVVDRLAANASDRPAKALTMLGRIVRTTFIMRYLHDAKMRDHVQLQLNRGEGRHALSKRLFFGNDGVFRTGEVDELMNKVSAQRAVKRGLGLEHDADHGDHRRTRERVGTLDPDCRSRSSFATAQRSPSCQWTLQLRLSHASGLRMMRLVVRKLSEVQLGQHARMQDAHDAHSRTGSRAQTVENHVTTAVEAPQCLQALTPKV